MAQRTLCTTMETSIFRSVFMTLGVRSLDPGLLAFEVFVSRPHKALASQQCTMLTDEEQVWFIHHVGSGFNVPSGNHSRLGYQSGFPSLLNSNLTLEASLTLIHLRTS